jgi:site-specific DNA-methyltransferase (adenine-specific)
VINLMQGDCVDRMKEIPDGSVDMILTDPPYGTTGCKWDSIIDLPLMWNQLKRIIKPNGAIVMTASQPFTTTLISSNMKMFKYCWVWEKSRASNFVHANFQPLKAHEDICVFSLGGSAQGSKTPMIYNPQHTVGKPYNKGVGHQDNLHLNGGFTKADSRELKNISGARKPRSVQYFSSDSDGNSRGLHPTQKPVALMEYLIKTYTNEGDTVLDFTMGSGTTGVACKNLDRSFIGIEMDEGYFKIAKDRIDNINRNPLPDFIDIGK